MPLSWPAVELLGCRTQIIFSLSNYSCMKKLASQTFVVFHCGMQAKWALISLEGPGLSWLSQHFQDHHPYIMNQWHNHQAVVQGLWCASNASLLALNCTLCMLECESTSDPVSRVFCCLWSVWIQMYTREKRDRDFNASLSENQTVCWYVHSTI